MSRIDHEYARGWQRYGFDNQTLAERTVHGASTPIPMIIALSRGRWQPQVSFAVVPPDTDGQAIGMHVHRDDPTGEDVEEFYIFIEGRGEMTFSNGDVVEVGPGDLVTTYPGTGHSFRALGGPVKLIVVTPRMFLSTTPADDYPEEFAPRIRALEVDDVKVVVRAVCTDCGAEWERPSDDLAATGLAVWAREHEGSPA